MSKTIWTIIGVLALVLIASTYKACDLYDELSVVRGQYEEAKRKAAEDTAVAEQMVKDAGEVIALQSEKISDLEGKVAAGKDAIKEKDKDLKELEVAYASGKLTDKQKIDNLEAQVRVWSDKFSVADQIIKNQYFTIQAWEVKFNEQVKISDAWKLRYENEARLHSLCRDQVKLLEKKVVGFSLSSKFMKTALAVAAGYVAYDTFIKK